MPVNQPTFYDTHAHLDDPDFAPDLEALIERARAAGIHRIISIGTDLESSRRAVALAERFDGVFAVAGWHPSHAHEAPDDLRPALRGLARHPKVVALGETGYDFHWLPSRTNKQLGPAEDEAHRRRQATLFDQHLEVALETGLKVVIHQREAFDATCAHLQPYAGRLGAVFHCFGETVDRLRRVLELGFHVSFTGIVTFKNAQSVRETVAATPLGRFMLETDSPYLAPVPFRGQRCEPAYVREIAATVAAAKGCGLEELSRATSATAEAFFPKLKGGVVAPA